jgi:hypothetical protein
VAEEGAFSKRFRAVQYRRRIADGPIANIESNECVVIGEELETAADIKREHGLSRREGARQRLRKNQEARNWKWRFVKRDKARAQFSERPHEAEARTEGHPEQSLDLATAEGDLLWEVSGIESDFRLGADECCRVPRESGTHAKRAGVKLARDNRRQLASHFKSRRLRRQA